jgi:hypothetical protein
MDDPKTLWLIAVNALLGLAVLACVIAIALVILHDIIVRARRRHAEWNELDRDMRRMFGVSHRHR